MRKSGQALIELVVGLIVILALTAGMLQVASLTRAHTDTMENARSRAGEWALRDDYLSPFPQYIAEVLPGPDGIRYTRDDETISADQATFQAAIVERSAGTPAGWETLGAIPGNRIMQLRATAAPVLEFGLIGAREQEQIEILPAVRNLIYNAQMIEVEGSAWMTWTRGIY